MPYYLFPIYFYYKTMLNYLNNKLRNKERSFVVITHYQRLLDYIVPDFVHVLYKGRIVKSGDASLAKELEVKGYDWIKAEVEAAQ